MTGVDHVQLRRIAEAQAGLFTARQAREAGMARATLSHHAGPAGRFERIARGLYRLRGAPENRRSRVIAVWLSLGEVDAVISHASALELHELTDPAPGDVHVTVPRSARWLRRLPGVCLHFAAYPIDARQRVRIDTLPVTDVERTIVDWAHSGAPTAELEVAVARALARGMTTPARLRRASSDRRARVGLAIERALHAAVGRR